VARLAYVNVISANLLVEFYILLSKWIDQLFD